MITAGGLSNRICLFSHSCLVEFFSERGKMRKALICIIVIVFCTLIAYGHSGRTDASGGHRNRKTGGYHYHNSGRSTSSPKMSLPSYGVSPKPAIGTRKPVRTVKSYSPGTDNSAQKWEYACFQYAQGTVCIWKTPTGMVDSQSITELYTKLKIPSSKLPFPPSFNMLNYAGRQGWELVDICSEDHSTTGMFIFWFKRPLLKNNP